MKKLLSICLAALLLLSMAGCGKTDTAVVDAAKTDTTEPKTEGIGTHRAEIEIQDYGTVTVELDGDAAPITVQNFMDLANAGFYNGLIFHRVIPGFMIQGGCPNGNGMGGPGYSIRGEFSHNGVQNSLKHDRGVLSMARAMNPNSAGSQFFIMVEKAPHLDGEYAAFGKVIEGMDVADTIVNADRDRMDKPKQEQRMKSVTVETFGVDYPAPAKC